MGKQKVNTVTVYRYVRDLRTYLVDQNSKV